MALASCPECSKEMSDTLDRCPHCGYAIRKFRSLSYILTRHVSKKAIVASLAGLYFLAFILMGLAALPIAMTVRENQQIRIMLADADDYEAYGLDQEAEKIYEDILRLKDNAYARLRLSELEAEKLEQEQEPLNLFDSYGDRMAMTVVSMAYAANIAFETCEIVCYYWFNVNNEVSDEYNLGVWDVEAAMNNLYHSDMMTERLQSLEEMNTQLIDELAFLQDSPVEYEAVLAETMDLYAFFFGLFRQAMIPLGTVYAYNEDYCERAVSFSSLYKKIRIMHPDVCSFEEASDQQDF